MGLHDDSFGAMLIGILFTMVLYGITTLQTYLYYCNYPRDSLDLKCLVYTIWILDTLHIIFTCHTIYYYLITNFGNPPALADGTWSLFASIIVNVVIAFMVQCFFTQRIYVLTAERWRWWVTGTIGFTVVAHLAFGLETTIILMKRSKFARLSDNSAYFIIPFILFVLLSDILIAAALCILLNEGRSGYRDTNTIINKLILYSINRCILICVMATAESILFLAKPHSFYAFAIDFLIGKLYANSLLASLNSRKSLRGTGEVDSSDVSTSFNLGTVSNRGITSQAANTTTTSGTIDRRIALSEGKIPAEDREPLAGDYVKESTYGRTSTTLGRSGTGAEASSV